MSESKASLLPANSSALEKALDLGFGTLLDRVVPPFPALMNPLQTPVEFLPYLAADRGVSEWNTQASETEKRLTVGLSWQIQRQAGTPKALIHAVESLGFTPNISAWYQQRPLGVPYTFDAMLASQFVQAMLSLVWSVTALLLMRHAARQQRRQQWSMGAVLLGLVVLKLFLIDLSNVGGIERIISFVGVGLLMVLIGYLAPFPKAAAPAPAEPQQGVA